MSQKDNSKNDYLLELEDNPGEPLKLKLDKIKSLVTLGKELYSPNFAKNISISELQKKYSSLNSGEKSDDFLKLAGRIMIFRVHGKATFCDIKDQDEKVQLYINIKNVGDEKYNEFLNLDIGDWVGKIGRASCRERV